MIDWGKAKDRFKAIARTASPIQRGEIGIWYDNAGHFCDVIWFSTNSYFSRTEHQDVLALVDDDDNLSGFKVSAVEFMGGDGGQYTAVNLKNRQASSASHDQRNHPSKGPESSEHSVGVETINARYDQVSHFFDLFWSSDPTRLVETENGHILAAIDLNDTVCGFRVINIDQLSDNEHGLAYVRLKTRMERQP